MFTIPWYITYDSVLESRDFGGTRNVNFGIEKQYRESAHDLDGLRHRVSLKFHHRKLIAVVSAVPRPGCLE